MQDYQTRVVEEKAQLDDKIHKLGEFIEDDPVFFDIDPEEQNRLERQLDAMTEYSEILRERIECFE